MSLPAPLWNDPGVLWNDPRWTWGGLPWAPVVHTPVQAAGSVPVTGVHLAVPFRVVGERAVTVDDGSIEEVAQNVAVIAGTFRGERLVVPDFGIGDPTFELGTPQVSPVDLESAVAHWEPRADLAFARTVDQTGTEDLVVNVSLGGGR